MAEVVVGELRNHVTCRSGSRVFRTSLEARSEVEKKTALIYDISSLRVKDRENNNVVAEVYQDYQLEISNKLAVLEY